MRISDWSSDVCSSDLLVIRPRIDIYMFRWLYRTLMNCNLQSYRANKSRMLRVATYSRACLEQLRQETGIAYEERCRGTLQMFRDQKGLDDAAKDVEKIGRAHV